MNVKTYGRHEGVLDIGRHPCDYYLVLAGPPGQARIRPWVVESVFLFDSVRLLTQLQARGVKIGVATSVRKEQEAARIFPVRPQAASHTEVPLALTAEQVGALALFRQR